MRLTVIAAAALFPLLPASAAADSAPVETASQLKPYNVTIRRFDISKGLESGADFVLPVNSPDAEHACASTIANASAFSKKVEAGKPLPLAFTCTKIETR